MTTIPKFYPFETLSADKLNQLGEAIEETRALAEAAQITDVYGGTFERNSGGTTLSIPSAASAPAEDTQAAFRQHPFHVSASVSENKLHLSIKGGNWHGRGAGNTIGISYRDGSTETDAEGKTTAKYPIKAEADLEDGEDLFAIPDLEYDAEIAAGTTFAVCLYSPRAKKGVLTAYPWVYYAEIEGDAATFRERLAKYSHSTVAVVGVWKAEKAKDGGGLVLTGVPGQMLKADFWYHNDQIFSKGKFGWSRVEGAEYAVEVNPGLVLIRPNMYTDSGRLGQGVKFSVGMTKTQRPLTELQVEFTTETEMFLKKVEMKSASDGATTEIPIQLPQWKPTATAGTFNAITGIQTSTETENVKIKIPANRYSLSTTSEYIRSTPNDDHPYECVFLTTAKLTPSTTEVETTIQIPKTKVEGTPGNVSYVRDVKFDRIGSTEVNVTIPLEHTLDEETAAIEKITGAEIKSFDTGHTTEVEVPGGVTLTGTELSGVFDERGPESSTFVPMLRQCPGETFSFSKEELDTGVLILLKINVSGGNVSFDWLRMPIGNEVSDGLGEKPQQVVLSIDVISASGGTESATPESSEVSAESFYLGVAAQLGASGAQFNDFAGTFPMAMVFMDESAGIPTVQPLAAGCITYSPPLALSLNTGDTIGAAGQSAVALPGAIPQTEQFASHNFKRIGETETEMSDETAQALATSAVSLHPELEAQDFELNV